MQKDAHFTGGEALRKTDLAWSEKVGGWEFFCISNFELARLTFLVTIVQYGGARHGGTGVYAKYVEPALHAAEHARRAVADGGNAAEWARAKDMVRAVGSDRGIISATPDKGYQGAHKAGK